MIGEEKSITAIAIYLRPLRAIFNNAIKVGDLAQEDYPFGDSKYGKYKIPDVRNFKRVISKKEIKKIFEYKPEVGSELHRCRDMWIFAYLANGLNMSDVFRLKYKNIIGDTLILRRQKTKNKKTGKPIVIEVTDRIKEIIDTWGQEPAQDEIYIRSSS